MIFNYVQKSIQIEQEKTCFSAYIKIEKKADIGKHISRFLSGVEPLAVSEKTAELCVKWTKESI